MTSSPSPPLIGVTTYGRKESGDFYLPGRYVEAVRAAGGIPVLLPPGELDPERILERIDGLLLSGGGDLDPKTYGGSEHPTIYSVDPERDEFELNLAQIALQHDAPILGICRGLQVLTVATGGDLVEHLPLEFGTTILHRQDEPRQPIAHPVIILSNTRLARILGAQEVEIVSWHHQAVRSVPKGWRVVAQAADGVVEALEHEHHPWAVSVQWHPELAPTDPAQQLLMQSFIQAAALRSGEP